MYHNNIWKLNIIYIYIYIYIYHGWCCAKYQTEAESIFQSKNSKTPNDASSTHKEIYYEWHKEREVHSEAFDALCNSIEV